MELVTEKPTIKDVPQGYKRTEVGTIPEDWEVKELGDIVEIVSGGTPSTKKPEYWDGDINWCTPTDITATNSKYICTTDRKITELGLRNSSANLLPKGTILLCSRATVGEAKIAETNISTNQGFKSLICQGEVYNEYLFYLVISNKDKFIEKAYGSTFLEISKKNTKSIKFAFPTLEEQQAIAGALSDVDDLIAELDALINKKQQVKKGAMQQLLTGNKRLPGFDGEWEEKKLGDMLYVQGGYAFKSANFQKFGVPIIRISNIQDGAIDLEESAFYSPDSHIPNEFKIKKGEALIAMSGATTGKVGLYSHDQVAYQNQRVGKFVVNDARRTDDSYILHLVSSDHFRKVLSKELEQGAQPNVSAKQLEGLVFNIPNDVEEQKAIAQILSDIDAEIQALQAKREKYEQIKQGMMQELLTGKTRLV